MVTNSSIHGNPAYINFEFSFFTLPMGLMILPLLYMPVTFIIILRILVKLLKAVEHKNVNVNLFTAISIAQFLCLLFFICDFFLLRIPGTGMITSWCASVEPNRYINILYTFTFYVNYATMLTPFLVSTMRLILLIYPHNYSKINGVLLKVAIPVIAIYPLFFTFFMFPAYGICTQAGFPYPFGAVFIVFERSFMGWKNRFLLLFNTFFWSVLVIINNSVILVKLLRLKSSLNLHHQRSPHSHRAEVSLSLTTFSMLFSYLSNGFMVIFGIVFPNVPYYFIMIRPFGNDLETCMVSWVFYLTHPVFRRKSTTRAVVIGNQNKANS